jgi:hypothetical protein
MMMAHRNCQTKKKKLIQEIGEEEVRGLILFSILFHSSLLNKLFLCVLCVFAVPICSGAA